MMGGGSTDGCAANGQARIPASKIVLIRPQNMTPQHGRTWTSRSLLLERDCGFGAKFLVVAVTNGQPDPLRPVPKIQRIVRVCLHREPVIAIDRPPQRG